MRNEYKMDVKNVKIIEPIHQDLIDFCQQNGLTTIVVASRAVHRYLKQMKEARDGNAAD